MKIEDLSLGSKSRIELISSGLTKILKSNVHINAPVNYVWAIFNDYNSWSSWNSFIPLVSGEIKVGNEIKISVRPPNLKEMVFKPRIFSIEENSRISWGGSFSLLYKGVHEFIFKTKNDNLTEFMQIEKFQGPIVLFMNNMIRQTAIGYINMNEEFKDHIENKICD